MARRRFAILFTLLGVAVVVSIAGFTLLYFIVGREPAVPSEATAKVNTIVSQRRGQLLGFDARPGWPGWDVVQAMIPESEIKDLIVELRSATAGVGTFTTRFDHLAELTGRLADQAIARAAEKAA